MTTGLAEQLTAAALAAPSMHNTQPWRIVVADGDRLVFRVDRTRLLPAADPAGHGLHLATGAALLNVRLTAHTLGYLPTIRLRLDGDDPDLLAEVEITGRTRATRAERVLTRAIQQRHTNRFPYRGWRIPATVLAQLADAARAEGAVLRLLDHHETARVLALTREANGMLRADRRYLAELARWTGTDDARPDGIPSSALGPLVQNIERRPQISVLSTPDDDRHAWLRAGLALQHVLLTATTRRVSTSLLYQPLQIAGLRERVRAATVSPAYPQMILRLGYGPAVRGAHRRPTADMGTRQGRGEW